MRTKSREKNGMTVVVKYGMEKIGKQEPYFSITADLYENGKSGGCQHDLVVEFFPELEPLIKWHLTSTKSPLHYVDNSVFWWERSCKEYIAPLYKGDTCPFGDKALKYFKSTCVYDEELDSGLNLNDRNKVSKDELVKWLNERKPKVMEGFFSTMEEFGVDMEAHNV